MYNLRHLNIFKEEEEAKINWNVEEDLHKEMKLLSILPEKRNKHLFGLKMKNSLIDLESTWKE